MKNQRGLTLVELLATLVLISIVLVMVSSIHLMGLKQYSVQSQDVKNQNHVRLAMAMVTKDVRSAGAVSVANNQLTLTTGSQTTVYALGQSALNKNGMALVQGISQFNVSSGSSSNQVIITIASTPNSQGKSVTLTTSLYIRT